MRYPESSRKLPVGFFILLLLALILNGTLISGFLLTVFLGWMIAEVMRPTHEWLKEKRVRNRLSSLLVTVGATLAIVVPIILILSFTIQKTVVLVEKQMAKGPPALALSDKVWTFEPLHRVFDDQQDFTRWLERGFSTVTKKLPVLLTNLAESLPQLVLQLFLALITCYFVLVEGSRFANWIGPRIPIPQDIKTKLKRSLTNTAVSSVKATLITAAAQATVILIGFIVLGLPAPHLAFGISFIFAWFPLFGVGPVWVMAGLFLLATGHPAKAAIMVGFGAAASLVDNFVRPWFLRGSSDIHPLVSLVFVFGNIEYFGILGVFTGPVLAKLLIDCLENWPKVAPALGLEER